MSFTWSSGAKSVSSSSSSSLPNKMKTEDKSKNNPLNKITGNKNVISNKSIQTEEEKEIHNEKKNIVNSQKGKTILQKEIENYNKNQKPNKTDNYNLDDKYYAPTSNKSYFYDNSKYYKNQEKINGIYGFKNNKLSNNCFMNSSLQNLFHCNFFLKSMMSITDKKLEGKKLANEIKRLTKEIYDEKDDLDPRNIKDILAETIEKYRYNKQNDANEFIIIFLNQLLKELYEIGKYDPGKIPINEMELDAFNKLEKKFFIKNKCFLLNLFYGRLKKEYYCENGHLCLVKFNNFNSLTLPQSKKTNTIEELLNLYQKDKMIEDTILCNECQKECKYSIKSKIYSIPKYFILNLENENSYNSPDIIYSNILETKNFMDGTNKKYYLTSLVSYSGNKQAGHYVAKVLQDNEWYLINDSFYWKIDASEIFDKHTKILFYTIEDIY
jgi:ubiquitin C-terminal hydrolase